MSLMHSLDRYVVEEILLFSDLDEIVRAI